MQTVAMCFNNYKFTGLGAFVKGLYGVQEFLSCLAFPLVVSREALPVMYSV